MDKICMYCGKPLEDGQECECQIKEQAQSTGMTDELQPEETPVQLNTQQAYLGELPEVPQEPMQREGSAVQLRPQAYLIPRGERNSPLGNFIKRCWVIFTRFFTHPVQIMRIAAEKQDFSAGLVFWIINALVAGVLPMVIAPHAMKSMLGHSLSQIVELSGAGMMLRGFLGALAWPAAVSALAFAFAKMMRSQTSFKSVIGAAGVSCVGALALNILAWLLILAAPGAGLCFYVFTQGIALVLLFLAYTKSLGVSEDKTVYCLLIALAIVGLVAAVTVSSIIGGALRDLLSLFGGISGSGFSGSGGFLR